MIHTTIGIYRNGDYKVNGVEPEDLENHIECNKTFRPGRALFVDGKCLHKGYISGYECDEFAMNTASKIKMDRCTAPYV